MSSHELSLVIPCYNEEKNIEAVALGLTGELGKRNVDYELILVDNGSKDGTRRAIRSLMRRNPRIRLVIVERNRGYGWGITRGLEKSRGKYVGFIDGDNQVSPAGVLGVFNWLKSEGLDLCKARRTGREDGAKRRLLSLGYDFVLSAAFLRWIRDVNAKPKIMTRECYGKMGIMSKDWFIDSEIMIKAARGGRKVGQFEVHFARRKHGMSNVRLSTVGEFLKNVMKFKLGEGYG